MVFKLFHMLIQAYRQVFSLYKFSMFIDIRQNVKNPSVPQLHSELHYKIVLGIFSDLRAIL